MFKYSFPLLIAGIAFVINEVGDRILLKMILPKEISSFEIGVYSACYKISIFMTIFIQGFKLGFEPYFFVNNDKTSKNYLAKIMNYFIAICCFLETIKTFLKLNFDEDIISSKNVFSAF